MGSPRGKGGKWIAFKDKHLSISTCKWPSRLFSWGFDSSPSIIVSDSIFLIICEGATLKFAFNTWETRLCWIAGRPLKHGWTRSSQCGREVSFPAFFLVKLKRLGNLHDINKNVRQNESVLNAPQCQRNSQWPKVAFLQQSCLFWSSACVKKTQEMLTSPKAFAFYMQKYALHTLALFLIQEFATCTIYYSINLVIRHHTSFTNVIYTFHLSPTSFDQDLGLTKADNVASLHPQADFYRTYPDMWHWEGQAEPVGAIKGPWSPVPLRHPWRCRVCMWAGNLSGCRLVVTLKSTRRDELQCKALWEMMTLTWADHLLSLLSFLVVVVGGSITSVSECLGGFASSGTFFHLVWGGAWSLHLQLSSEVTPQSWWFGLNWGLINSSHFQSEWNLLSRTGLWSRLAPLWVFSNVKLQFQ